MVSKRFDRSVEIAKALQHKAQTGRCFHVTFIYNRNRIISIGINDYNKTHPKAINYKKEAPGYMPSIHSELSAVIRLGEEECSDYDFVNVRIDNNGELAHSAPCPGCQMLLKQTGYRQLFYSNNHGDFSKF